MGRNGVAGRTVVGVQIGHDASAAVVHGGRIVAAAAEGRHWFGIEQNDQTQRFKNREPVDLLALAARRIRDLQ